MGPLEKNVENIAVRDRGLWEAESEGEAGEAAAGGALGAATRGTLEDRAALQILEVGRGLVATLDFTSRTGVPDMAPGSLGGALSIGLHRSEAVVEASRESAQRKYTPGVGIGTALGGLGYGTSVGGKVGTGFENVGRDVDNFRGGEFNNNAVKNRRENIKSDRPENWDPFK